MVFIILMTTQVIVFCLMLFVYLRSWLGSWMSLLH